MSDFSKSFVPLAWRNIWRNPRRTVITLIVVSVGLWSILFFNSLLIAWMQSSKDAALKLLIGSGQIHAVGYMDDPNIDNLMDPPDGALLAALEAEGMGEWTSRLILPAVVQSEYKTLPVMITGVDPAVEAQISSIPSKLDEGRYLRDVSDDTVFIGKHLAERLKTGIGRRVIIMTQNTEGSMSEQSFDIVGLFDADQATEDFYVFTGLAAAQQFAGLDDQVAQVVVQLPDEVAVDPVFDNLAQVAPDLDVRSWKKINLFLASSDTFMGLFIYIWLGVVFSLMAIGIINTQLMAVFERTQEFGLLRALGMKPRRVLAMVTLESAILIGIGVLCGIALALLSIASLSGGIDLSAFAAGLEMFQGAEVMYPKFEWDGFIIFPLIIWMLGVLVALWPARRASKCSPVEAMRRGS